jgi:ribonuclease HII
MPDWSHEDAARASGHACIAGVDEAGRGCLAGPVTAAAVIFLERSALPPGLDDSKKLSRRARQRLYQALTSHPGILWAVASASVEEIDRINILQAALLAMHRALTALPQTPNYALIDGNHLPTGLPYPAQALIGGDAASLSIAAASILAKETRDLMMESLDREHPHHGFARHKGYGTAAHLRALAQHGPTPHHRRSFAPVAQLSLPFPH